MADQIWVDLDQVRESNAAVKLDTEAGLRPGLSDTDGRMQQGVRFARSSPSGEAQAAAQALIATLKRHRENGQRHLDTAQVLTGTLDQVLALYAAVDESSEVDIAKVLHEVEAALPKQSASSATSTGVSTRLGGSQT